jgi:murein tripeptide amidase MpaA
MKISTNFDGGNILLDSIQPKKKFTEVNLNLRPDTGAGFMQWFYFKLTGAAEQAVVLKILNASEAFSPAGWTQYKVCASYDRNEWFRCHTNYEGQVLSVEITPQHQLIYFAYFPPYSYEQHLNLIAWAQLSPVCQHQVLGETVKGKDIDLLTIGEPSVFKRKVWIIARQHAGESMASWFMEGLLEKLLDENDPQSLKLLRKAVFYVVPHMNPDGSQLGNIRVNAAGKDLNREWASPDQDSSPEVYYVRKTMVEAGLDLAFDIHGDEELPYNFVSRIDGIPAFDERLSAQQTMFVEAWKNNSPDFQDEYGYPVDSPGKANLAICSKNLAQSFNTLALTVEMPFKDNANMPNARSGWSIARSKKFGASLLSTLLQVVDQINRV